MGRDVSIPIRNHQQDAIPLTIPGNTCVKPQSYLNALKALKKTCPSMGSYAYMTDGFEYVRGQMVPSGMCGQAEYQARGLSKEKHNEKLLACLKSKAARKAVTGIEGGKGVRKALVKAVDDSIPSWWDKYSHYILMGLGSALTFFLFGKNAIDAWFKGPPTGTGGDSNPLQKKSQQAADTASKMVAVGATLMAMLAEASKRMRPPPAPACPSGFCVRGEPLLDGGDAPRTFIRVDPYAPIPWYASERIGKPFKVIGLAIVAAAAAVFGPKFIPKGMIPAPAPAGYGGVGLTPGRRFGRRHPNMI